MIYETERFGGVAHEVVAEAIRSIDKHGEQMHLPMGTGPESFPLDTFDGLGPHPADPRATYSRGLSHLAFARHIAHAATLDTKAHSQNEGGDGTVTWWHILREEVFEAAAEDDPGKLRSELVQVAAVALKMIDALDHKPSVPSTKENNR